MYTALFRRIFLRISSKICALNFPLIFAVYNCVIGINTSIFKGCCKVKIPKIIHFIWAGGNLLMHKEYLKSVLLWASKNSTFDVYFWIDPQTGIDKIEEKYRDLLNEIMISRNINSNPDIINKITFKNIDIFAKIDSNTYRYIRYQIDRLRPNYGACLRA